MLGKAEFWGRPRARRAPRAPPSVTRSQVLVQLPALCPRSIPSSDITALDFFHRNWKPPQSPTPTAKSKQAFLASVANGLYNPPSVFKLHTVITHPTQSLRHPQTPASGPQEDGPAWGRDGARSKDGHPAVTRDTGLGSGQRRPVKSTGRARARSEAGSAAVCGWVSDGRCVQTDTPPPPPPRALSPGSCPFSPGQG